MSAPLRLTAAQLRDLGDALDNLTKIRRNDHVSVTAYGPIEVGIGASNVRIDWDDELDAYVVDDRNGD